MVDAYLGEIRIFAGNYAPVGWAFCDGRLLSILDNQALFSLLGDNYGGDARTTFALPDLRGRVPMNYGIGPGLSPRYIGSRFGTETETLQIQEMPQHNHNLMAKPLDANYNDPQGNIVAKASSEFYDNEAEKKAPVSLSTDTLMNSGHNEAHSNMQPCLGLSFIICLEGLYPPRN